MHGVAAIVGLSTDGSAGVSGGNKQIFEAFLNTSRAQAMLNTKVCVLIFVRRTWNHYWSGACSCAIVE